MTRPHDREAIAEILGPCKVSWSATETLTICCNPAKLQECVKYMEDKGFRKVMYRHPPRRDKIAVDLTRMIVTGEKEIY